MTIVKPLALIVCLAVPASSFAQTAPSTATASAKAADALGTWNATFNTQQGVINAVLKFEKTADKITGTIGGPEGSTPLEAEVKGKAVTVWFNYAGGGGGPIPIEMTGTIEGDSAKGMMTAGGSPAGDWTMTREGKGSADAKPAAAAKPAGGSADLSGDWNLSLALDTITATPALTLKQAGDKLTGEYTSQQYGKFPVTGQVTGTAITFSVPLNIEGNAITAVYSGVVQADGSLKGTVDIGGAMGGTFSAVKKK